MHAIFFQTAAFDVLLPNKIEFGLKIEKIKGGVQLFMGTHCRAAVCHLPYGITRHR